MKRHPFIRVFLFLLTAALWAPRSSGAQESEIGFSSDYTDFQRDCQYAAVPPSSGWERDLICRGFGGFNLYVAYHQEGVTLRILNGGPESIWMTLAEQGNDALQRRVEWRKANGRPFAVLYKENEYQPPYTEGTPNFDKKYMRGQRFIARGLPGFESIDFSIEISTTPHAAEMIRELSDNAYREKMTGTALASDR